MVTIVGLGPGGIEGLTIRVLDILKQSPKVILRTARHPITNELKSMGIQFDSMDDYYEKENSFSDVYSAIAEEIIREGRKGPLVYAVPGHPLVGEASVDKIIDLAEKEGLPYRIIPAMSFLDSVMAALKINVSASLRLIDGLRLLEKKCPADALPDPTVPNIVMQVYDQLVASEVKLSLMNFYPDEHEIVVIKAAGVPNLEKIERIPLFELDRQHWIDHLTCVYLPPVHQTKTRISRYPLDPIVDCLEQLRDEHGCPWDREQTHQSLKKYLIEETYEVLEAIDEGNMYKICDELGDLLLQVVFHAQIAREEGHFDINDVVEFVTTKMERRHPHIFGDTHVSSSQEVLVNWDEIKRKERQEKGEEIKSALDGIPNGLPALAKADKIQRKAATTGFDWADYRGGLEKIYEELKEVLEAIDSEDKLAIKEELGDLLFAVVNMSRLLKVDAEEALSMTVTKFYKRFTYMEKIAEERGISLTSLELAEMDVLWNEAKEHFCKKN